MYNKAKENIMSEENKIINENKCFCQSPFFKKFSAIALGTFVGGFCALSLFTTLNKPPMMPMNPMMMNKPPMHHFMPGHKKHDCNCPCHKKMMKKHFEKKAEFYKDLKEKKELEEKK